MSYQPLHHKYRPQTFADLVGQEAIATTLSSALQQQRIAPAYLFTGARGTGKTSSARILAKSLNCLQHPVPTAQPCGECEVCVSIANGSALDVIEIDAASNTGVDNIRELIERSQFAPVQCRYKVYVVDECHMLSTAAFNALLKTLEEPPDLVVFVLATTDPQRVLPTIISRCQRFDFRRIPLAAIVGHLRAIADKENIAISDDAITLVAQISQGGLRDAESLLDQLSLLAGEVSVEKVWDLVGAVPERDLMHLLEAIAANDPESLLDNARRLMDRGREPMIVLQNLASFYRDLLIAKTAPARGDLVALTPPTWETLCQFAQNLDTVTILTGQQHLRSCEVQLKHTTQPRLWLEVSLMGLLPGAIHYQLSQPPGNRPTAASSSQPASSRPAQNLQPPTKRGETPSPGESAKAVPVQAQEEPSEAIAPAAEATQPAAAEEVSAANPEPPPKEKPAPKAATVNDSEASNTNLEQIWQQVIGQIQPYSSQVMVRQQCHLLEFNGQQARLGVNSQPLFKMAQGKLPHIEAAFERVFQKPVRVSLEVSAAAKGASEPNASVPPQSALQSTNSPPQTTNAPQTTNSDPRPSIQPASPPPEPPPPTTTQAKPPAYEQPAQPHPKSSEQPAKPFDSDAGKASPATPEVTMGDWQEDEVAKAAKQLADFFGGKVVDIGDDLVDGAIAESTMPSLDNPHLSPTPSLWEGADEEGDADSEDEEIPF